MAEFTGGEKLHELLDRILKGIKEDRPVVRVGFLEGSTCGRDNRAHAPEIAFILENGAPAAHIPPRPFFRNMIQKRKASWSLTLQKFLKANDYDSTKALMGTGLIMGEQLQLEITEFTDPGNAESTIKRKGFDKPLEDSKNMKRAVAAEIDGVRKQAGGK